MPDETTTTVTTVKTTEEKAATVGAAASSIAGIAGTIAALAAPQFLPLVAAFAAVLKYAPTLYIDFVQLFSRGDPTPEQKSDFNKKLSEMMNPSAAYADPTAP